MVEKALHDAGIVEIGIKSTVGVGGAVAAMELNEFAGLIVAILTAIYMVFQIEAAWVRRKERKKNEIPKP